MSPAPHPNCLRFRRWCCLPRRQRGHCSPYRSTPRRPVSASPTEIVLPFESSAEPEPSTPSTMLLPSPRGCRDDVPVGVQHRARTVCGFGDGLAPQSAARTFPSPSVSTTLSSASQASRNDGDHYVETAIVLSYHARIFCSARRYCR